MEQAMIPEENNALLGLVIFKNEYCDSNKCDDCVFAEGDLCRTSAMIHKLKKEAM